MSKILFVYPNAEGMPGIPVGISVLSAILKNYGHETALFDITFMVEKKVDHEMREKLGIVIKTPVEDYWGTYKPLNINEEFKKKIKEFNPDLIAFSIVENNYACAKDLMEVAKEVSTARIVVGGTFPTVAPEFFKGCLVCAGEGEWFLRTLADNMLVPMVSKKYYDWEPNINQDLSIFDQRHLYKPFMGKVWKAGAFELSRGCPFSCGYCINEFYRKRFKSCGKYHREKPIGYAIEEMHLLKKIYKLTFLSFVDESFAMMDTERIDQFCKYYGRCVNLPYFIQTRANDIQDIEVVKKLKDSGCQTIVMGVECGNEEFRKKVLNKPIKNEIFEKAFFNCQKVGIRTTANIIIGLPFETENNILESAEFCKRIGTDSLGLAVFAPYHGTLLRRDCITAGFIEDTYDSRISVNTDTILNMPQLPREKILNLYYNFKELVYG
jgi:radical SAM superfamily enzyme YgiQ (UPF0313 family)